MYVKGKLTIGQQNEVIHNFMRGEILKHKYTSYSLEPFSLRYNTSLDAMQKPIRMICQDMKMKLEHTYSPSLQIHTVHFKEITGADHTSFFGANRDMKLAFFDAIVNVALHVLNKNL